MLHKDVCFFWTDEIQKKLNVYIKMFYILPSFCFMAFIDKSVIISS